MASRKRDHGRYGDQVTVLGDLSVIQQGQMVVPVITIGKPLGYRMSYHAKNKELTLARGEDVITRKPEVNI